MEIWIVDYNTYSFQLDEELLNIRKQYFQLKKIARERWFGLQRKPNQKVFSVGALRLCTILQYNGFLCKYLTYSDFFKNLKECELPDLIGFSAVCPSVALCADLIPLIREKEPKTKIVLGGAHALVAPLKTKEKFPDFDLVVPYEDCKAISYIMKECFSIVKEINSPLEYLDYSLLPEPLSHYDVNLFTSLGCPNHCAYCQDYRRPIFLNDLDGGIGKIFHLLEDGRPIHYFDSIFGLNKYRRSEVCKAMKPYSNYNFLLSCDMRADEITPNVVLELAECGIKEIRLGLDSGDNNVLLHNDRGINNSTLIHALKVIKDISRIYVSVYSLTGLSYSTKDTVKYNEDLISYLLEDSLIQEAKNAIYVPYPADDINYSQRGIYINCHDWKMYDRQSYPVYDLQKMNADQLWMDFLHISKYIVKIWRKTLNISEGEILYGFYPETFAINYGINDKGDVK